MFDHGPKWQKQGLDVMWQGDFQTDVETTVPHVMHVNELAEKSSTCAVQDVKIRQQTAQPDLTPSRQQPLPLNRPSTSGS